MSGDVWDMLLSFGEFSVFKEMILSFKKVLLLFAESSSCGAPVWCTHSPLPCLLCLNAFMLDRMLLANNGKSCRQSFSGLLDLLFPPKLFGRRNPLDDSPCCPLFLFFPSFCWWCFLCAMMTSSFKFVLCIFAAPSPSFWVLSFRVFGPSLPCMVTEYSMGQWGTLGCPK